MSVNGTGIIGADPVSLPPKAGGAIPLPPIDLQSFGPLFYELVSPMGEIRALHRYCHRGLLGQRCHGGGSTGDRGVHARTREPRCSGLESRARRPDEHDTVRPGDGSGVARGVRMRPRVHVAAAHADDAAGGRVFGATAPAACARTGSAGMATSCVLASTANLFGTPSPKAPGR